MQSKSQLINTNQTWNAKKRYKINAVVTYLGKTYQNSTGKNSEPGDGSDWYLFNPLGISGTDDILNESDVDGITTTEALNNLLIATGLTEQIEFTAIGGETTHDIGTTALVKTWFWDGSPQAKSQWSQTGSVLTFAFPLSTGSFNIFN